jgi:hypothetical protein
LGITGHITADNKVYDGTTAATILTRTLTGSISGDIVSYVGGQLHSMIRMLAWGKTVTATGLSLTGSDAGNYTVNPTATTTANITPLGITGNFTASSKVYDATTNATVLTRTLTGVLGSDDVTLTAGNGGLRQQERRHRQDRHSHGSNLVGRRCGQLLAHVGQYDDGRYYGPGDHGQYHGREQGLRRHDCGDDSHEVPQWCDWR